MTSQRYSPGLPAPETASMKPRAIRSTSVARLSWGADDMVSAGCSCHRLHVLAAGRKAELHLSQRRYLPTPTSSSPMDGAAPAAQLRNETWRLVNLVIA